MERAGLIPGLVVVCVAVIHPALGHVDNRWEEQMQSGSVAYHEGRFSEAERYLASAVTIAKAAQLDVEHITRSLDALVLLYLLQKKYAEAELLAKEELAILEQQTPQDDSRLARALNNLSQSYVGQGKLGEAESALKRAWAIEEKDQSRSILSMSRTVQTLVGIYVPQRRYKEADNLLNRLRMIKEQIPGTPESEIAEDLDLLALVYWSEGKNVEAEKLFKQAIAIYQGSQSLELGLVSSLENYAVFLRATHRDKEAANIDKQVNSIKKRAK